MCSYSTFVLYDGAEPIAGAGIYELDGGYRSWRDIWALRDRPDAVAELIVAVQKRVPNTTPGWLAELVAQIRQARCEPS